MAAKSQDHAIRATHDGARGKSDRETVVARPVERIGTRAIRVVRNAVDDAVPHREVLTNDLSPAESLFVGLSTQDVVIRN